MLKVTCILLRTLSRPRFVIFLKPHISSNFGYKTTLMSGSSISKVLLLFRHLSLKIYCARTFFYHQRKFMFPLILQYWEKSRAALINQLKGIKDSVWAGDERFDSMGHSAKYGCYTMLNCNLTKLVHFELLQVG